jgi:TRAP-type mannitol/chloroaromatic compound transport system permease small subunit
MSALLQFSRWVDRFNERLGHLVYWCVLAAVLISSGNAMMRYTFNMSSNAWLEIQWYLFAVIFLMCSGYTLLRNEHIRIDIVTGHFSRRTQTWIDVIGGVLFLLPMAILIMVLSWPVFMDSWERQEISSNAGGLIVWPVKALIPLGFLVLTLQGLSETIKRVAFLMGVGPDPLEKHQAGHGGIPAPDERTQP